MKKRLLGLLLCALMVFMPVVQTAAAEGGEVLVEESIILPERETYSEDDAESNQELLEEYIKEQVFGFGVSTFFDDSCDALMPNECSLQIFRDLKEEIARIAANGGSSVISINLEEPITFNYPSSNFNDVFWQEVEKVVDTSLIHISLLADCPYELYWYDKTRGMYTSGSYETKNGKVYVTNLVFGFTVADEFLAPGDTTGGYTVITPGASADDIAKARNNIAELVLESEDLGDLEKITAYKNYICSAVDYNYDAVNDETTPYGNPWQLIWVFDDKPATKVVCEGYSKAFQYLCELSDFDDPYFETHLVTGVSTYNGSGGGHMWNQITLNDVNYLVDITNADGNPHIESDLFMNATPVRTDGNGFVVSFGSGYLYYTFYDNTKTLYHEEFLKLGQRVHTYTDDPNVCDVCGRVKASDHPAHDGITFTPWTSSASLPTTAGNYYLTTDVTISDTWYPGNGIKLCLNGHSIIKTTEKYLVYIGVTLDIYDCTPNPGSLTHADGALYEAVYISGGTFNLHGGKIAGNTGCGVWNVGGTFNMYGGSVSDNTLTYASRFSNSGVWNSGTFNMYGGSITGNTAEKSNGGGVYNCGIFNMYGGSITGNTAVKGGGVWNEGTMTVTGLVNITGNTATDGTASNLYLATGKTVTVESEFESSLSTDSRIGISTEAIPTNAEPVDITADWAGAYEECFIPDDTNYKIGSGLGGRLTLVPVKVEIGPGDLDEDGDVDLTDADFLYDFLNDSSKTLTEAQLTLADIDKNGEITLRDAMLIYDAYNG